MPFTLTNLINPPLNWRWYCQRKTNKLQKEFETEIERAREEMSFYRVALDAYNDDDVTRIRAAQKIGDYNQTSIPSVIKRLLMDNLFQVRSHAVSSMRQFVDNAIRLQETEDNIRNWMLLYISADEEDYKKEYASKDHDPSIRLNVVKAIRRNAITAIRAGMQIPLAVEARLETMAEFDFDEKVRRFANLALKAIHEERSKHNN